jgi:BMFP domain-containing protein YqiC
MLDLEKHFSQFIKSTLSKLNLVTREEFDVQTKVLAKTRAKLEELEKKLADLEKV